MTINFTPVARRIINYRFKTIAIYSNMMYELTFMTPERLDSVLVGEFSDRYLCTPVVAGDDASAARLDSYSYDYAVGLW